MLNLNVVVAGNGRFALAALELVYDLGHEIVACITSDAAVSAWASERGVQASTRGGELPPSDLCIVLDANELPKDASLVAPHLQFRLRRKGEGSSGGPLVEASWLLRTTDGDRLLPCDTPLEPSLNGADVAAACEKAALGRLERFLGQFARSRKNLDTILEDSGCPPAEEGDGAFTLRELASLHGSNSTASAYATAPSLDVAFREAAARFGPRTALEFGATVMTYAELDALSDRVCVTLERRYASLGRQIGKDTLVGMALEKSLELYISILGILKAGAAYVPLDPNYSSERLAWMIEDCEMQFVLTSPDVRDRLPKIAGEALNVRECLDEVSEESSARRPSRADSSALAVVIYTSGSTGRPKGAMLEHRNILQFSAWYTDYVGLSPESKPLQFSTISFDASLLDIFPTLFCGATLVIPSEADRSSFERLSELVDDHKVTHAFLPPALLAHLPTCAWPTLQQLITGGDVCDADTIRRWSLGRHFHNIYGPTECTVLATTIPFVEDSDNRIIGRPIANTKIYLLDSTLQPVPTGELGELYIAGDGVGRGYLKRPELNAERFVLNPFAEPSGSARMYRTGDLARWTTDGCVHFSGRIDTQVKIRGFRVELGEIETAILQSGMYLRTAVVAGPQKKLVAYVVPPSGESQTERLRERLAATLPDYMVPAAVVELDALPSTQNGKIDRPELAGRPVNFGRRGGLEDREPTPLEKELMVIWAEVLRLTPEDIRLTDSFFALGGDSLLVSAMILAVKKRLAKSTILARFMENATIASLAILLSDGTAKKGDRLPARVYEDAKLDPSVRPTAPHNPAIYAPASVLLTGATGFLGAFLVDEILRQTDATLYCLVRAPNRERAEERLVESLEANGLQSLCGHPRLRAVAGDLEAKELGLDAKEYARLASSVDIIYHNGANVNHVYDYEVLYAANVQSTLELLRLAVTGRSKALHFVSTVSAASAVDEEQRLLEDGPAAVAPAFINNGYNVTKWVSEHLVWQAIQRGVPGTIFRPGNITGHSTTGLCHPNRNRILLVMKGSLELGAVPAWDMNFDVSPVDYLANSIVRLSLSEKIDRRVFHLHNPKPLTWIEYVSVLRDLGYDFDFVEPSDWRTRLLDIDQSSGMFDVVAFYLDDENEDIGDTQRINSHETAAALRAVGISYPDKSTNLIRLNMRYLKKVGFLPPARRSSLSRIATASASMST